MGLDSADDLCEGDVVRVEEGGGHEAGGEGVVCGPALDEGNGMVWVDLFDIFEVDGFRPDGWEVFSLPIIRIRSMQ